MSEDLHDVMQGGEDVVGHLYVSDSGTVSGGSLTELPSSATSAPPCAVPVGIVVT